MEMPDSTHFAFFRLVRLGRRIFSVGFERSQAADFWRNNTFFLLFHLLLSSILYFWSFWSFRGLCEFRRSGRLGRFRSFLSGRLFLGGRRGDRLLWLRCRWREGILGCHLGTRFCLDGFCCILEKMGALHQVKLPT